MDITNISVVPTGTGKAGEALPCDFVFTLADGTSKTVPSLFPAGKAGARGSIWETGKGYPTTSTDSQSGDLYMDTDSSNLYQYDGTNWNPIGKFASPQGPQGVSVEDITIDTAPSSAGDTAINTITFKKSDGTSTAVPFTTMPGPQGANGGSDPYSAPNEVNFVFYAIRQIGASQEVTVDLPYGLVFAKPPHVKVIVTPSFPSEAYGNYTDNWSGNVFEYETVGPASVFDNSDLEWVSRTQFCYKDRNQWSASGYCQYEVRGIIDPDKTAANQAAKGITPPERIAQLSLSKIDITQSTPTPGQNSTATLTSTLNNNFTVQAPFTVPCGPPGLQGIPGKDGAPGADGKDGAGAADDPQIGRVDGFYNKASVPKTHLILDGGTFDKTVYPELYSYLGTNVLQDFRGMFLRGRDPNNAQDVEGSTRDSVVNPTPQEGTLIGMSTIGGRSPISQWYRGYKQARTDAAWLSSYADGNVVEAHPFSLMDYTWPAASGPTDWLDYGTARPKNMNVVWAIKAKTLASSSSGTSSSDTSNSGSGSTTGGSSSTSNTPSSTTGSTAVSGGSVPAGIAMWYSGLTAPDGWLIRDGGAFDTTKYPDLAKLYPNGTLPDDRGLFIRGYDPTGTVDSAPNRKILSFEEGTYLSGGAGPGDWAVSIVGENTAGMNMDYPMGGSPSLNSCISQRSNVMTLPPSSPGDPQNTSGDNYYGVTRPKNRNYLPIISTGSGTSSTSVPKYQVFTTQCKALSQNHVAFPTPFNIPPTVVVPQVYSTSSGFMSLVEVEENSVTNTGFDLKFGWVQGTGGAGGDTTDDELTVRVLAIQ